MIIGSGLTGALIAYTLLSRPGPEPSILMLEARTAASGATGRNGEFLLSRKCNRVNGNNRDADYGQVDISSRIAVVDLRAIVPFTYVGFPKLSTTSQDPREPF